MASSGAGVVACEERDGTHLRSFRLMERSAAEILRVVDRLNGVENFLAKDNSYRVLVDFTSTIYLIDDVGAILFKPHPECLAETHCTFWDGRLRGREPICRAIGQDFLLRKGVSEGIVFTAIPSARRAVIAFSKRIGFEPEKEVGGLQCLLLRLISQ